MVAKVTWIERGQERLGPCPRFVFDESLTQNRIYPATNFKSTPFPAELFFGTAQCMNLLAFAEALSQVRGGVWGGTIACGYEHR